MLHEFLTTNREALIARCRQKVASKLPLRPAMRYPDALDVRVRPDWTRITAAGRRAWCSASNACRAATRLAVHGRDVIRAAFTASDRPAPAKGW